MDSSILELKEALEYLTDYSQHWGSDKAHGADAPGLGRIYQTCNAISSILSGANNTLSEGWHTSAELFYKIFSMAQESLDVMYKGITLFSDETYQAELAASSAVEAANSAAKDIIALLNALDGGSATSGTSVSNQPDVSQPVSKLDNSPTVKSDLTQLTQ